MESEHWKERKTWRIQCSSNSANKILSFILKFILILPSTKQHLVCFNTKMCLVSNLGIRLRDQEAVLCLTVVVGHGPEPPFERLVQILHFSGRRLGEVQRFVQSSSESQDWNPSSWPANSVLYDKTALLFSEGVFKLPRLRSLQKGPFTRVTGLGRCLRSGIKDHGWSSSSWYPKPISS